MKNLRFEKTKGKKKKFREGKNSDKLQYKKES